MEANEMSKKIYYKSEAMNAINKAFVREIMEVVGSSTKTETEKLSAIDGILCFYMDIDENLKDEDEN
jgi:hypothetical protein